MSAEQNTGESERPWRPTKEFLLSDPRSAQIREVCIGIVRRLDTLLHNPEVARSQDEQSQIYAELEAAGGKLIELGIVPDMHVDEPAEAFKANPVMTAEYVAGQLYETTGHTVVSETAAMPIIQEMTEAQSGPVSVISGKNLTPKLREFIIMREMVNVGYSFLDAKPQD